MKVKKKYLFTVSIKIISCLNAKIINLAERGG
jgi:hypothetical protein